MHFAGGGFNADLIAGFVFGDKPVGDREGDSKGLGGIHGAVTSEAVLTDTSGMRSPMAEASRRS